MDKFEVIGTYEEFGYSVIMSSRNGLKGVKDNNGNIIVPCFFDRVEIEKSGLIKVFWTALYYNKHFANANYEREMNCCGWKTPSGRCRIILNNKIILLDKKYVFCQSFQNGLAIVSIEDSQEPGKLKYGLINEQGEEILKPVCNYLCRIYDGYYCYGKKYRFYVRKIGQREIIKDNTYGLLDRNGNFILSSYAKIHVGKEKNGARVVGNEDNLKGLLGKNDKVVLPLYYTYISKEKEGIRLLKPGLIETAIDEEDEEYNYARVFDCKNERVILLDPDAMYADDIFLPSEGMMRLKFNFEGFIFWEYMDINGQCLHMNVNGERILGNFQQAYDFENGFAVAKKDNKFGVIDKMGNIVILFEYDLYLDRLNDGGYKFSKLISKNEQNVFIFDKNGVLISQNIEPYWKLIHTNYNQWLFEEYYALDNNDTFQYSDAEPQDYGYNSWEEMARGEAFDGNEDAYWNID